MIVFSFVTSKHIFPTKAIVVSSTGNKVRPIWALFPPSDAVCTTSPVSQYPDKYLKIPGMGPGARHIC